MYRRAAERGTTHSAGFTGRLNLFFDLTLVVLATAGSYGGALQGPGNPLLFWVCAALCCTWIVVGASLRHYAWFAYQRAALDETALITTHLFAVVTLVAVLHLLASPGTPLPNIPRLMLLLWVPSVFLRLCVFRRLAGREEPDEQVLIVGAGPIGRLTAQDLRQRGGCVVTGHLRFPHDGPRDLDLLLRSYRADGLEPALLGDWRDLERCLRERAVDEVYIAGNVRKQGEQMQEAIHVCEKFGVPFSLPAYSFRLERAQAVEAHLIADGYLHYQNTGVKPQQLAMKRLFDIVASGCALWLLLPLLLAAAALVKLTSRGPVLFKQKRVGLHGRTFNMLKLRTMVVGAESLKAQLAAANEQSGPVFKMRNDPRVTRVGRFLRKYSIDELPQLVNVLRGDMSVVGPRPPVPSEVAKYEGWQRRRLSVRPGLTCIWQVSGRNQISFEEWMYLDMQYIDHWSLAHDFQLIFRTVPVVISGRGAS